MNFIDVTVLLVLSLNDAFADFSYHSSLNSGGHPILRAVQEGPLEVENKPVPDTSWVLTLQADIRKLVKEYGYDAAKPFIQTLVEDAEKKHNVLLHVNVKRKGPSEDSNFVLKFVRDGIVDSNTNDETRRLENFFLPFRNLGSRDAALRGGSKPRFTKNILDNPGDPQYLIDLHEEIRELVKEYGYHGAKPYIKEAVHNVEQKRNIKLYISVAKNGESTTYYKTEHDKLKKLKVSSDDAFTGLLDIIADNLVPSRKYINEDDWKQDLKKYVKALVATVDTKNLILRLRPVVMSLEKEHKVKIQDIDMDKKGNIVIKMKSNKRNKKNDTSDSSNKGKKKSKTDSEDDTETKKKHKHKEEDAVKSKEADDKVTKKKHKHKEEDTETKKKHKSKEEDDTVTKKKHKNKKEEDTEPKKKSKHKKEDEETKKEDKSKEEDDKVTRKKKKSKDGDTETKKKHKKKEEDENEEDDTETKKKHKNKEDDTETKKKRKHKEEDENEEDDTETKKKHKHKEEDENEETDTKTEKKKKSKREDSESKEENTEKRKKKKSHKDKKSRRELVAEPEYTESYENMLNKYNILDPTTTTEIPNLSRIDADIQLFSRYLYDKYPNNSEQFTEHIAHFLEHFGKHNGVRISSYEFNPQTMVATYDIEHDPNVPSVVFLRPTPTTPKTWWLRQRESKEEIEGAKKAENLCFPQGLVEDGMNLMAIDKLVKVAMSNKCPEQAIELIRKIPKASTEDLGFKDRIKSVKTVKAVKKSENSATGLLDKLTKFKNLGRPRDF